ncbi:MAG: C-type lectin domain-containing protein [Deltaproteobacteria bacterium]|nr:C-type lectin domain-containing protein [Deltaproteobacteria bacterium]
MQPLDTARRAAGLVLWAVLCGCHDWAPAADAAGDGTDAADVEELGDALDLPPDVADRGDDAADDRGDEGGAEVEAEADAAPDDVGPEVLPSVCGNDVLEPGEDCELGQDVECTTVCGSRGRSECPDDCRTPPPEECPLPAEVCNGRDDDCNGIADDPRSVCPDCVVVESAGHVYHFCIPLSWPEASATCRDRGMYLVTIDDEAEDAWLAATAGTLASGRWWIGFNDRAVEGLWVWDGPTPAAPYTNWTAGEPNDTDGNEDCGEMLFTGGQWNDDDCADAQPYVCEFP